MSSRAKPMPSKSKAVVPPVAAPEVVGHKRKAKAVAEPVQAMPLADVKIKKPRGKKAKNDEDTVVSTTVSTALDTTVSTAVTDGKAQRRPRKPKRDKALSTRTPSSYVLFSMEHRKQVMLKNPELTLGDVSKACGAAWRALDANDKDVWIKQAAVLKAARTAEVAELLKDQPTKKKRTPSSYLLFAMEHRKVVLEESPTLGIGDVSKKCGEIWKAMDDVTKKGWQEKANALKNSA